MTKSELCHQSHLDIKFRTFVFMNRFFNTAGPCVAERHYTIDPLSRLEHVMELVEQQKYFILHAPRQTGKSTTIIALMDLLNSEGKYIALYANIEAAQALRSNVEAANEVFLSSIARHARHYLPKEYWPSPQCFKVNSMQEGLSDFLSYWCAELPKPLVLFIDEADALIGDSLLSLLRQIRAGYNQRPKGFPHSIALIGLRDLRDYRIYSDSEKRYVLGGSAFNIKDKSLVMNDFSLDEVRTLYAQHTAETGQQFESAALNLIFEQTQGQPWLVNAIGRELCFETHKVMPEGRTIVPADVYRAVEILIQRRDTHLDQLSDKLTEPRVARVIDAILSGADRFNPGNISTEDIQYVIDLGLVTKGPGGLDIANPIYREVVPRELTYVEQVSLPQNPAWYVLPNGKLDIEKVLARFIHFYKENGELLTERELYTESAHHLSFMAWLQRIVNGGGYIRREYGLGLKFIDLVIEFADEKFAFELKAERHFKQAEALEQIAAYAKRMNVSEAYLVVFRRRMTDPEIVGIRENIQHGNLLVHLIWM
jgi:hypothetical protein